MLEASDKVEKVLDDMLEAKGVFETSDKKEEVLEASGIEGGVLRATDTEDAVLGDSDDANEEPYTRIFAGGLHAALGGEAYLQTQSSPVSEIEAHTPPHLGQNILLLFF